MEGSLKMEGYMYIGNVTLVSLTNGLKIQVLKWRVLTYREHCTGFDLAIVFTEYLDILCTL